MQNGSIEDVINYLMHPMDPRMNLAYALLVIALLSAMVIRKVTKDVEEME